MTRKKISGPAAVIDIGSHSIRLIIGEKRKSGVHTLELLKNVVSIGRDTFEKNVISEKTVINVLRTLRKYKTVIDTYQVGKVRVIATTAVREAQNRDIFIDTIYRKTGFRVEVLSVGDVVYYLDSFLYHQLREDYPLHSKTVLIAEFGSGTIDFSVMRNGYMLMSIGLPSGTLRLKNIVESLKGTKQEISQALREYVANEFRSLHRYVPDLKIDDAIVFGEDFSTCLRHILTMEQEKHTFYEFREEDARRFSDICTETEPDELVHAYHVPVEIADMAEMLAVMGDSMLTFMDRERLFVVESTLNYAVLSSMLEGRRLTAKHSQLDHLLSVGCG